MNLAKLVRSDFGSNLATHETCAFKDRVVGYLTLARPIFIILTPLNAASAAVLGIRGLPSWELCLAGFFTGAFAAAGVNIFNQYTDRVRDGILWPQRSIPSGRVKASGALALSLICYAAALALCWFCFNPTAFYLLLGAIILGSLYSSFLRDKVGYLSLPPIEGLIFLCGWAALSPGDVFSSALPWYLYSLGVVWQSAHILVHYSLNVRTGTGNKVNTITPALFYRPSMPVAARITLSLTILLFLMSILLPLLTSLSWLYIIPVSVFGLYTIYRCRVFFASPFNRATQHLAWTSLSLLRLVISVAIILSILVYR